MEGCEKRAERKGTWRAVRKGRRKIVWREKEGWEKDG